MAASLMIIGIYWQDFWLNIVKGNCHIPKDSTQPGIETAFS